MMLNEFFLNMEKDMHQLFSEAKERLKDGGTNVSPVIRRTCVKNARNWLWEGVQYACSEEGVKPCWIPPYEEIADWLTDNHNKGLVLSGPNGSGKTLIGGQVLPMLFNMLIGEQLLVPKWEYKNGQLQKVQDLRKTITTVTHAELVQSVKNGTFKTYCNEREFLYVDDVGGVVDDVADYGVTRHPFTELVDCYEKNGHMLIISTNVKKEFFEERFTTRTYDRICKLCKWVNVVNDLSFRQVEQ